MPTLTHRLQILLDEDRYARLEKTARRRGVPVAVVVREALDRSFSTGEGDRRAAGDRLLAAPSLPVEDWPAMKARMLEEMSPAPGELAER